jgi:phosphatidate cytidylyltransferase
VGTFLVFALMFGNRPLISALGVLYTGLPAIALIWIREDVPWGLNAILFLLLVVVATDTFAFLTGRLIGGPKLLERLSPKKTWSGLIGGITAAGVAAALFAWGLDLPDVVRLGLLAVCLGIISQAGDLAESALKRAYGVKDSSNLIPGHGGFMDRMDGIAAAAVAAGLAALFINPTEPARLLLFGN